MIDGGWALSTAWQYQDKRERPDTHDPCGKTCGL